MGPASSIGDRDAPPELLTTEGNHDPSICSGLRRHLPCALDCLRGRPRLLDDASMDQVTAAGLVDFDTIINKDRHIDKTVSYDSKRTSRLTWTSMVVGFGRGLRRLDRLGLQPRRNGDLRPGDDRRGVLLLGRPRGR